MIDEMLHMKSDKISIDTLTRGRDDNILEIHFREPVKMMFIAKDLLLDTVRPKGVWVGIDEEPHEEWECCNCGNIINTYMQDELEEYKYCHKCGAKMSTPWAEKRGEE